MFEGKLNKICLLLFVLCLGSPWCHGQQRYPLSLVCSGKDSVLLLEQERMPLSFENREACAGYLAGLPELLKNKGYLAVSVDTLVLGEDSAYLEIYVGDLLKMGRIVTEHVPPSLLEISGWRFSGKDSLYRPAYLKAMQEKIVSELANKGYPFASVSLDSMVLENGSVSARISVDSGRRYSIDSIRVFGEAKISNRYLQSYLQIPNGTIYQTEKLEQISKRIQELPFLRESQPWQLSMLSTGAVLDMYLEPRKSSEVDVLIGFLPGSDQPGGRRFLLTGEANIQLENALQQGELIGVNWQQLQLQSPRLNLAYNHPYIAGTNLGIDFSFELFKKDSAFLNLQARAGIQYLASAEQTGSIFLQTFRTNLLTVDTFAVQASRRLPEQIDMGVNTLGVSYRNDKTDYRNNPRRGMAYDVTITVGQKKIRKNNAITGIKDPGFNFEGLYDSLQLNSYQFIARANLAKYFPLGRQSTLKTAFNGAWLESPQIFRNELFQIGGYRLLRGFDEQSIFVSGYGVLTGEYRYLLGRESFFSVFTDAALTQNRSYATGGLTGTLGYMGAGIGMTFETKAGIFNLSWAVGKRSDLPLDFRQSKIHFGYLNYF